MFQCTEETPTLHHTGCLNSFGQYIRDHAYTLGGVGLGFAIVQVGICYKNSKLYWQKLILISVFGNNICMSFGQTTEVL